MFFFVNCFAFGKPVNHSVLENIAPLERSKVIAIKRIKTASRPFPFFVLCIAETAVCIRGCQLYNSRPIAHWPYYG
jgi:hypothetical protein